MTDYVCWCWKQQPLDEINKRTHLHNLAPSGRYINIENFACWKGGIRFNPKHPVWLRNLRNYVKRTGLENRATGHNGGNLGKYCICLLQLFVLFKKEKEQVNKIFKCPNTAVVHQCTPPPVLVFQLYGCKHVSCLYPVHMCCAPYWKQNKAAIKHVQVRSSEMIICIIPSTSHNLSTKTMNINSITAVHSTTRKLAAASSPLALFPDEKSRNVQPTAQVFVYIIRNNILSLRQEVSAALIRITGIYYTQQSPYSELFDNGLSPTKTFSTH